MTPCSTPCAGLFCVTFLQAPRTENHDFMALTGGRSPAVAAETVQVRVEIKQPLGIAIIGSLIVSHLLTPYTTPVVYLYSTALAGGGADSGRGTLRPCRCRRRANDTAPSIEGRPPYA